MDKQLCPNFKEPDYSAYLNTSSQVQMTLQPVPL